MANLLNLPIPVTANDGGTGQSSYTTGDLLYASSATALAKLSDVAVGNALTSGGVGVAPSWGKIALSGASSAVTGTLPIGNGGTNQTSYAANALIFQNSSNTGFSSDSNLSYTTSGSNSILTITTSTNSNVQINVTNTLVGSSNNATIQMSRGDSTNGNVLIYFADFGGASAGNKWSAGMYLSGFSTSNPDDFVFRAAVGTGGVGDVLYLGQATGDVTINLGNLILKSSSKTVQISSLTASSFVFTDASKNLVSTGTAVLGIANGGTNISTYTLGDTLYASATNTLSKLSGNITTTKQYLSQTGTGTVSAAPVWSAIAGTDVTGAALTATNDTNVTLTLGGTPATALLRAASITAGWTGTLSIARGGTNTNTQTTNGVNFFNGSTITSGSNFYFVSNALTLSNAGTVTAPTPTTAFNLSSTTQSSARIVLSGQEFFQAANTSTDGLAVLLGANRSNDRQLWLADSTLTTQNTTNPVLRLGILGTGTMAFIDSTATNGTTVLPIQFGNNGAVTTLSGSAINVPSLTASSFVFTNASENLASTGTAVLGIANGGTNISTYTLGDTLYASATNTLSKLSGNTTTTKQYLSQTGTGTLSAAPVWSAIAGTDVTGAALTASNDTNVTLTLGGTPATALLRAASITAGWTGALSIARGGTNAVSQTANGVMFVNGAATGITSSANFIYNGVDASVNSGSFTTNQAFGFTNTTTGTPSVSTYITAPASSTIGFYTASTQRLTIDGSGNVAVNAGNLTLNDGDLNVTLGNLTLIDGDLTLTLGNLIITSQAKGLHLSKTTVSAGQASGLFVANVVLTAGTVTITNASITANHVGFVARVSPSGPSSSLGSYTVTTGSGTFTVTSSTTLDTSTLAIMFILAT